MKKSLLIIFILCLLGGVLFAINRDLFHFVYRYPYTRTFSPETETKANYVVSNAVLLKPAAYQLHFSGFSEGKGNGCFVIDSNDEIVYASDIPQGEILQGYPFQISQPMFVRVGFSYSPESGRLEAGQIIIESNHVLYKESVIKHAVLSFFAVIVISFIGLRLLRPDLPDLILEKTGVNYAYGEKVFLFLLILTMLSSWPLFDFGRFPLGDDFYFHLSRIEGMASSLKAGYFPPRILLGWMENYGVGCGFYYPDFFMFLPVTLFLLGFSAITSLRVFLILCTFFSLLTIYLTGKAVSSGRELCGAAAALIYAFASYRLICIFYRNAVGEVQAFVFYPLIIWGFVEILRGNTSKWGIFALGFFGMLMSHMVGLAISGFLCTVCLFFSAQKIIKDRDALIALSKAAVLTVLLGAFFLLPMAEQTMNNQLQINSYLNGAPPNWESNWESMNMTSFSKYFRLLVPWIHGVGIRDINPNPGWIILAVPLLRGYLLFSKKTDEKLKIADKFLPLGMLLLIMSTDLFPWKYFQWLLIKIQYSWRLLGPATVLLSLSGCIYLETILSENIRIREILLISAAAALISGFPILVNTYQSKNKPLADLDMTGIIVNGAEYMPVGFNIDIVDDNKDQVLYDENLTTVTEFKRRGLGYDFSFAHLREGDSSVRYTIPLVYYYGYKAVLFSEETGTKEIPAVKGTMGLIEVNDDGLQRGSFKIWYEKTSIQKVGEAISITTLLGILYIILRKKNHLISV